MSMSGTCGMSLASIRCICESDTDCICRLLLMTSFSVSQQWMPDVLGMENSSWRPFRPVMQFNNDSRKMHLEKETCFVIL
jgi:hypothetical protein